MRLIGLVLALSLALAPLAAEAQQKGKVYRIGLLSIATVTYIDAFRQGLRDLGYVEGRTIVIEYREAQSYERLPELAKELVGLKPDIIVSAGGSLVARAVKAVTSTIPVVFLASDVVAGGLVASLSRPDGNLTGLEIFTTQLVSRPSGSRHKFSRVIIDGPLSKSGDARQDLVGGLGPDERLRISIMRVDERADGGLQFRHAAMHSAPDLLVG